MKIKYNKTTKHLLISILIAMNFNCFSTVLPVEGIWKGKFMQHFEVEIIFLENEQGHFDGKIKMYDGTDVIQADDITEIEFKRNILAFLIPDKETRFSGMLSVENMEIQGAFIFPDGSKHPLKVVLINPDTSEKGSQPEVSKSILTKKFTSIQLEKDLLYLNNNLANSHPQYNLYTSNTDFEAMYNSVIKNIDQELTIREFYTLIAPVVAKIGCSHTGIRVPQDYHRAQQKSTGYFPAKLFISDERAWVLQGFQNQDLIIPGSEITHINHVPMQQIIKRLLSLIPAEGNNLTSKYHELNQKFNEYYYFINNSEHFEVTYIKPDGQSESTSLLEALMYEQIYEADPSGDSQMPVQLSFEIDLHTAILKIQSFDIRDFNTYIECIDSLFVQISDRHIENLILDLRGNNGGHPIFAAILYSYLSQEEFTYFKKNESTPEFEPLYNPMPSDTNHFSGTCYVLVDGGCLSTTGHLISLLKYHKRAVFIGEEPGSWFSCNDNGQLVKLPNTQIEVYIPRSTFQAKVNGYESGDHFEVDHPVKLSILDLVDNRDICLEYALNLIANSNQTL